MYMYVPVSYKFWSTINFLTIINNIYNTLPAFNDKKEKMR